MCTAARRILCLLGLIFAVAGTDPAVGEVLLSDNSVEISGTGARSSRSCTVLLKPTQTTGEEAPRLTLTTAGVSQLSFGVDKPSRYANLAIVQNNNRRPLVARENLTTDQFSVSDVGKGLKSKRVFFVTAQLAGGSRFASSRYEGVDFDATLAKIENLCPFDAESLMEDLSSRERAEQSLRISGADLVLIRWVLTKRYGSSSNKPDLTFSLLGQERSYLKRYADDNGLPISRYLTAETARRLTSDGQSLANLANPPPSTPTPTPTTVTREFQSYDNIDFDGDDIKPWLMNSSFGECRTACMGIAGCQAFTFNKRRNVCILKTGTGRLKPSIEAISASLTPVSVPRVAITVQNGIDLPGGDLDSDGIRNISVDQCAGACTSNASCVGFSYVKSKRWCWMKRQIRERRLNDDIVSGLK